MGNLNQKQTPSVGLFVFVLAITAAFLVSPWFLLLAALPIVVTMIAG